MKYLSSFILVGFLSVLFFGFLPMNHDIHGDMNVAEQPCPIISLINTLCGTSGSFMLFDHISALQSLSNIPLSPTILGLSLIAVFMYALIHFLQIRNVQRIIILKFKPVSHESYLALRSFFKVRSWLSLFVLSPSFI
ncbi:MAG: hypothetical protein PHG25_00125 [Candidatus Pacebacteria bacterium]|nr:hypothetical protein [Candidatus Paceibacterota bacterium]